MAVITEKGVPTTASGSTVTDNNARFICVHCWEQTDSCVLLRAHLSDDHGLVEDFACPSCSATFLGALSFLHHFRLRHGEDLVVSCNKCPMKFSCRCEAMRHCRSALRAAGPRDPHQQSASVVERSSKCPLCPLHFFYESDMVTHLNLHLALGDRYEAEQLQFACATCGLAMENNHSLHEHLVGKHGTVVHSACPHCGLFLESPSAASHVEYCVPEELKWITQLQYMEDDKGWQVPYLCCSCDARFPIPGERRDHEDKHWHECRLCGSTFPKMAQLRKHRAVHESSVPATCPKCHLVFADAAQLSIHVRRDHENDLTFTCEVCEKAFLTKKLLGVHRLRHKRRHKCDQCGRAFGSRAEVLRHGRTHDKQRPYACLQCPETFTQSGTMKRHMRTFHPQSF